MENDSLNAAAERIKAGAQIPRIEPSQIEHVWEVLSRIPVMLCSMHLSNAALNDYRKKDESARKHVFAAAATIPCDKNDLAEALAERLMRDASSDVLEQTKEE